jgi:hypothetical protein
MMQVLALTVFVIAISTSDQPTGPPGAVAAERRADAQDDGRSTPAGQQPSIGRESRPPLTNEDVVRMTRAQLSPAIILATIDASDAAFDVSPDGLIALKEAGVPDAIIRAMVERSPRGADGPLAAVTPHAPEKSDRLSASKDPGYILQNFKTMYVDAEKAMFFGSEQMKAALGKNKRFAELGIAIVDDLAVADVVLEVGYTFAWDYPFSLRHQNTSLVVASGKGSGPFSGPAGAKSVAGELVKILAPHRAREGGKH